MMSSNITNIFSNSTFEMNSQINFKVSAKKKKLWKTKEAFEKDFGLKIGTEIRNCKEYTVSLSIWLNNELASLPGSNENATKVQRFTNQPDETKFSLNSTTPSSLTFNIDDGKPI